MAESTSAVPLSSSEEDAIKRVFQTSSNFDPVTPENIDFVYEISRCADWINSNKYEVVALQFPCDLARDTVAVIQRLQQEVTAEIVFLGDTSYGSCCVDEVQAQKLGAKAVVHFGPACLSPTTRLPVLFLFGRRPVNVEDCQAKFQTLFPDASAHIALMYDTIYTHAAEALYKALHQTHPNLHQSELVYPDPPPPPGGQALQGQWGVAVGAEGGR